MAGVDDKLLPPLTGSREDLLYTTGGTTYVSSASALTVHFQSMGNYGGRQDDHFTASYMCSEAPPKPHEDGGWVDWELLLLISLMLAFTCANLTVMKRRRARLQVLAGRAPLVPAIEAVATPVATQYDTGAVVDVETAMNPASGSVSLVATSSVRSAEPSTPAASASGLARTASSLTDRWECPVCHRENAAYRARCEGCPGPSAAPPSPVSVVGTPLVASPVAVARGGGGGGSPLVVQSSVVLGVAMETLNSVLRACSLEQYEGSLQDLGVVEADDLKTLRYEQLESLGMKPVEVERLRRRLQ